MFLLQNKRFGFVFLSSCCFLLILQCAETRKKIAQESQPSKPEGHHLHHHHHHTGSGHTTAGSDEESTTASPPEMIGMKGLASAGIAHFKPSGKISKCLGHDFRLEKIVQVTKHCDGETVEWKNDTAMQIRSLCYTACMYKYLGLIGEDLMFTANIDSVVVDIFPPIAHPQAKRAFRICAKQSVLPLNKADNCTSFGPVKGCIMKSVQSICNGEYY